jgi:hypothetical protein
MPAVPGEPPLCPHRQLCAGHERLYDSSRYRYRHYLRELEPVVPILEPLIKRLGYAVN